MIYASTATGTYGDVLHECVACHAGKIRYWRQKDFHYTQAAQHKEFHIYRCESCGTGFLNRPPAMQWLQAIYQYSGQALKQAVSLEDVLAKEAQSPNCQLDAKRMSQTAKQLNRSGNQQALDIGSGFGFYTHALRAEGFHTVSINPGEYENAVFKQLNGDEPLTLMFEDYQADREFGVVMMSQVLEHLLAPDQAIKKVADVLAKDGILVCAVPNYASFLVKLMGTKDNACLWVPEHVNYFTNKGLKALLARHGLQVIKVEQITRIPFNALSKRLGLQGQSAARVDRWVQRWQSPFASLMNRLGLGIYINVYAVKQ